MTTRAKALLIRPDVHNPPSPPPLPKSFECRASRLTAGLMSTHMLPDCQSLVGRRQSLLESRPSGDLIVGRWIVARRTVSRSTWYRPQVGKDLDQNNGLGQWNSDNKPLSAKTHDLSLWWTKAACAADTTHLSPWPSGKAHASIAGDMGVSAGCVYDQWQDWLVRCL